MLLSGLKGQVRQGSERDPAFDVWEQWAMQEDGYREVDLYVAAVVSNVSFDSRPFWPDEEPELESIYPWRFEIESPLPLGRVRVSPTNFTRAEATAIRSCAIQPAPVRYTGSMGSLLGRVAFETSSPDALAGHLRNAPISEAKHSATGDPDRRRLFGRDYGRNRAVEIRAVELVTGWLQERGWTVTSRESENLGYDLDCYRADSQEDIRHLEVKGTTGSGEEVLVSPNEVRFARENPTTAELFVVADIQVRSDENGLPIAADGQLVHNGRWTNLDDGLTPTGFRYVHGS